MKASGIHADDDRRERERIARRLARLQDAERVRRTGISLQKAPSGGWCIKIGTRVIARFDTEKQARTAAEKMARDV